MPLKRCPGHGPITQVARLPIDTSITMVQRIIACTPLSQRSLRYLRAWGTGQ